MDHPNVEKVDNPIFNDNPKDKVKIPNTEVNKLQTITKKKNKKKYRRKNQRRKRTKNYSSNIILIK
jgi:hypothetical protein